MRHMGIFGIRSGFVILRSALWVLVCTALICLYACSKEQPVAIPPPIVEIAEVVQKDVPIVREFVGTTDGLTNAVIRAQVAGYLMRQDYKEGDPVKKGQMLFEIDPRIFQAALDQAQATLSQVEARYAEAHANLMRDQPLFDKDALSKKSLDATVAADRAAESQVLAAKAAVERTRLDLDFTKITSPIDGMAGIAKAQVGDLVGPQSGELTTVSTIDPTKVHFAVNEQFYIDFMKRFPTDFASGYEQAQQLQVELILEDGSLYPHKGRFYAIDRGMDVGTGTLRVEGLFPNPNYFLRPGQFARVRVVLDTKKGALLIPQRALIERQGVYQVAVVGADNKVDIRNVKPGARYSPLLEIEEGLKPGERVIAEGVQKVAQGMPVNPKPFAPASSATVPEASPKQEHLPATEGR